MTTASAQDEAVLSGQIIDPHGNPVTPGAVTAFDPFLSSKGTARTTAGPEYAYIGAYEPGTGYFSSYLSARGGGRSPVAAASSLG
ncbi:MAG: hypothetical protein F4Y91_13445 [Gemmatimonadetes bacterium]|nr:hypothetical protein [Gemmatimonadota bacterium]MXY83027.1 hypothetical protein [Gemmatimonadota bacterium]MYB68722.1 hypothetical protein [Gemmatimonadota bacterium]